jgi:DNA polymerase kappa
MLATASGHFPKDFSNTKLVQNGKIISMNQQDAQGLAEAPAGEDNANKEMASYDMGGQAFLCHLGLTKAGMAGVDKEVIKSVIHDSSAGSEFYKTQELKLRLVEQKVKRYLFKLRNFKANKELWAKTTAIVKDCLKSYLAGRELRRTWMHIDLDAFYASCEIRD